jgi:hypothetical protein
LTNPTLMTEAPTPSAADASPAAAPASADQQQAAAASDAASDQQEAPAAGEQADGAQEATKPEDKPAGAPEKYEFKAPDGMALDGELMGEFEGIARELNLPQEKAQLVVDKLAPKMAERMVAQQAQVVQQARTEWAETARADKEFGGDSLPANLAMAQKAMTTFGTPELRTLLDESGLGNHPEVIRAFYRAGKAISEDSRVVNGQQGNQPASRDPAKSLYPNQH